MQRSCDGSIGHKLVPFFRVRHSNRAITGAGPEKLMGQMLRDGKDVIIPSKKCMENVIDRPYGKESATYVAC